MFHTVYQITNKINSKIYIGKHITKDLSDGYMGSGKLIRAAINKYGVENFQKEILHIFDNEADMNAKEAELVTAEFVLLETNYNLCVGGQGGFSYLNSTGLNKSENQKQTARKTMLQNRIEMTPEQHRAKGLAYKANYAAGNFENPRGFQGKHHTTEFRNRHSKFMSENQSGSNNSQFGTMWITDGTTAMKVKTTTSIPQGWKRGRK